MLTWAFRIHNYSMWASDVLRTQTESRTLLDELVDMNTFPFSVEHKAPEKWKVTFKTFFLA